MGYAAVRVGFNRLAEALFRSSVMLNPENVRGLRLLAWFLCQNGAPAEAIPYYEQVLRLAPSFIDGRVDLGLAFASVERFPDAIEQFQRALTESSDCVPALRGLGMSLIRVNHAMDAVPVCERWANKDQMNPEAWAWLGRACADAGRWDDAALAYQTAYGLNAAPRIIAEYVAVVTELGRNSDGEDVLRAALQKHQGDTTLRTQLAAVLCQQRRHADAEELLREILQTEPKNVRALELLAILFANTGRGVDAATLAERLLQESPDESEAYATVAWIATKTGSPDKALRAYDRALELHPGRLVFLAGRATVLNQIGRHSEVEAVVRAIIARDPTFFDRNSDWVELGAVAKASRGNGIAAHDQ